MPRVRDVVKEQLVQLLEEEDLPVPEVNDELVLLDCGLDSLGFAVLVTRLEAALGYDPFTLAKEAIYPVTLADLVHVYATCDREPRPSV